VIAIASISRVDGETYDDFMVRLFEHKGDYGLNCQHIADIMNEEFNNNFSESKYRKEYNAFNRGRVYEREKSQSAVATKILALSDFHFPYALTINTFSKYAGCVDILVLNGDLQDCQSVSAFPKKYRIPFIDEMIGTRQYLIDLIELIQPRKVIITRGNHENRLLKQLTDRLNDDLLGLMPDSPIDLIVNDGFKNNDRYAKTTIWYEPIKNVFDDIEIEYTGDWWCQIGKTIFAHPLAYSSGMLKTTEKAVNYFLRINRDADCIVLAHTHHLGQYIQGGIQMFEQGCCCKVEASEYMDGKLQIPQQKGFVYLCQDKEGNLLFDKCKLVALN
jgi:predicted phosphodiesterase